MGEPPEDLPLFTGDHIPAIRFERALDRLDLVAALADAPERWRDALAAMAEALGERSAARSDLPRLVACRRRGWPEPLERTWQRLVGLRLDAHGVPGVLDDQIAAAFLLRGGERTRARRSVLRHLEHHPRDERGWRLLAEFEPLRAAVRCAFHGGPLLAGLDALVELAEEDGVAPLEPWLLSYSWLADRVGLDEVEAALIAEATLREPPMPVPGDGRAFAWYLLDAGGRPLGPGSKGVVEARRRLQGISPAAFRRYLARAGRPVR